MKSREGNVVEIDTLLEEMKTLAKKEVEKRLDNSNSEELEARADKIAKGAIKFYLLQYSPKRDIRFNPKESISFEGVTGPYCQYGYARAQSIFSQSEVERYKKEKVDFSLLGNKEELWLLRAIEQFPETVTRARKNLDPSAVCTEVYKVAKCFNQFYQKHRVIDSDESELTASRLKLVQAAQIVLKQGLNLLGIDVLEKM